MRAIVQRVSSASVTVDSEVVSNIAEGLMVLVGLGADDTPEDVETIARKVLNLKIFSDANTGGHWKASVVDRGGEVLCVSQFTLFAKIVKNKPDFHKAMPAESSRSMYATFLERMGKLYDPKKIKDGKFGAMMSVGLTNEGPVTFTLDSRIDESGLGTSGASTPASSGGSKVNKGAQRAAEKALRKAAWESAKGAPSKDIEQERSSAGVTIEDEVPENAADNQIAH